jgi:hypothetical protein
MAPALCTRHLASAKAFVNDTTRSRFLRDHPKQANPD